MQADPADQKRLLDLQQADTALTQLTHRRGHLPQDAEITELTAEVNQVTDEQARHEATASDLARDISRVEREIEQVRARADKDRQRQNSGAASPKELENLTHELHTLARRQTELEDQELSLMERREEAETAAAGSADRLTEQRERLRRLESERERDRSDLETQLSAQRTARDAIATDIADPELVRLYEKIRTRQPIAAALLRHRRCESCRIEQSGADLAELRAAAARDVVRCDNCRAILVRTEESGL